MPETGMIMLGIVIVVIMIFISLAIKVIPENEEYVIERLGAYHKTLGAGIQYILPNVDRVAKKVSLSEQKHTTNKVLFNTLDDEELELQVSMYYQVKNAKLFTYALHSEQSLSPLILDKTKYEVLKNNKQDIKLDLKNIELAIIEELHTPLGAYGIVCNRVSIDI